MKIIVNEINEEILAAQIYLTLLDSYVKSYHAFTVSPDDYSKMAKNAKEQAKLIFASKENQNQNEQDV